jgi:hypothetical protein
MLGSMWQAGSVRFCKELGMPLDTKYGVFPFANILREAEHVFSMGRTVCHIHLRPIDRNSKGWCDGSCGRCVEDQRSTAPRVNEPPSYTPVA